MYDCYAKKSCEHRVGDINFTLSTCPRCKGTGRYFDIGFDSRGDIDLVDGGSRLTQDVEKVLLEFVGSNIEDSQWGSMLFAVSQLKDYTLVKGQIVASVIGALRKLRDTIAGEDFQFTLPATEKIARNGVGDLKVYNDTDPRRLLIQISIVSESYGEFYNVTVPINF
jgi:hypothetical protein